MFATIYVPNFYLQAALRHQAPLATTPVGLIDEKEKKPLLIQLNPSAEAAGVRKGMTPSQGLARCLSLLIKTRSPAQEKSTQDSVLHSAFTLSPYVEETGPGVCTVQFTDNRNLIGKISRTIEQLAQCGIIA
jgi:nucleotidyltransferase/DNA polymerase involved in DNA repair